MKPRVFWKDRRYADWWSFIHATSGTILGLIFLGSGFSFGLSLVLTLLLATLWELIEPTIYKILGREFTEEVTNQISDVFFGFIGFGIAWYLVDSIAIFILIAILLIIPFFFYGLFHLKRVYLKQKQEHSVEQ